MLSPSVSRSLEAALERFLPKKGVPPRLLDSMRYTLFNAGKRLRPALTLEVCRALGGDLRNAFPAACAVEYIHTYSLIHDDLPAMDDDDERRGKPSSHVKFGEATAILAGDALQAAAFEAVARTPDRSLVPSMILSLAEGSGAAGMVGGQEIDLAPRADVNEIHAKKTAALFKAATHLGALAARSSKAGNLARYGLHLGLAFQAVDDILDAHERGRKNYARLHGLEAARRHAAREIAAAKAAIRFMGVRGAQLNELADFVLARKH
jgi:geranylgeranyl diphosphate synthase type II